MVEVGGLQTFAASARALGQFDESGRSMRGQIHKFCKRSNGGSEPTLTGAAITSNVCSINGTDKVMFNLQGFVVTDDYSAGNLIRI